MREDWRYGGRPAPADPCAAARQTLSAGIDGEARELERAAAARHAAGCAACRDYLAASEQLSDLLRSAPVLAPSASLGPSPRRRGISRPVAAGGTAVAICLAALLGALVSARVYDVPSKPPAPELRLANLDTKEAQKRFQERQVQALLHLPLTDPTVDRALQHQRLG